VHDGEATRSSGARRFFGGLLKSLRPRVLIGLLGKVVVGCGAFVNSRRWLVGSLLISGLLLALVLLARPTPHPTSNSPGDPSITFDDVKSFPLGSKAAGSRFRPGVGEESRSSDDGLKSGGRSSGLALDASASEEGAKSGGPLLLSRRLDAVRSRQARGAWLTGTIEKVAETSPGNTVSSNAVSSNTVSNEAPPQTVPGGTPSQQVIAPQQAARPTLGPVLQ